jgi:hypothetical protein
MASVMILADLQEGKRDWKRDTRTNSFTSGPRSPTKMLYSGPRLSLADTMSEQMRNKRPRKTYRLSTKPPPEAQLSLKTRDELGTGVPVRVRAFWAASEVANSTKQ